MGAGVTPAAPRAAVWIRECVGDAVICRARYGSGMVGRKSCEQKSIPESDRSGGGADSDFAAAIDR